MRFNGKFKPSDMIIGRVITDNKEDYVSVFNEDRFIVTDSFIESDQPTLIIGYNIAKKLLKESFNIIDRKSSDNVFWTFTEKEEYYLSKSDIIDFKELCYKKVFHHMKYRFIDPFILGDKKYSDFFLFVDEKKMKMVVTDDMVYYGDKNDIYGVSRIFDRISFNKINQDIQITDVNDFSDFKEYLEITDLQSAFMMLK